MVKSDQISVIYFNSEMIKDCNVPTARRDSLIFFTVYLVYQCLTITSEAVEM